MTAAFLESLSARGFRNLEDLEWRPGQGSLLLVGGNGAGKTSLLEAVYLVATTRSFRAPRLADCCRHDEAAFHVGGRVGGERRSDLAVGWSAEEGRLRTVNGRTGALTEHLEVLPVVSWSAADGEIVVGGPGARRRFLDQGVVGSRPGALEVLSRYRRALEQKRELLASRGSGLAAWNEVLAAAAAEIAGLRADYVDRLSNQLGEVIEACGLELPALEVRYRPSPPAALEGAGAVLAALERLRSRELERRTPLAGSHRDELEIRWGGHEVRRVASAGERKLIGLALTAARARVLERSGRAPLLLLDDLDSELDRKRLAAVWRLFAGAGQLFASTNRKEVWDGLEVASEWRVEGGRLEPRREP